MNIWTAMKIRKTQLGLGDVQILRKHFGGGRGPAKVSNVFTIFRVLAERVNYCIVKNCVQCWLVKYRVLKKPI